MKTSLVTAVLNEEKTIQPLLLSIFQQTQKPDEVIIVDGGSKDKTIKSIKDFKIKFEPASIIRIIVTNGANRAKGRNTGIKLAKNEIIVLTDAGCVLEKNWLAGITAPFINSQIEVVSGYYRGHRAASIFERCVAVYTLVVPERVRLNHFLPSARSMALRKKVWQEAGGFPEEFSLNEDYVFAKKLKKQGRKFYFAKKAIVFWQPRENLLKAFLMFYNFARGDSQAGIFRPKVCLVFLRYLLGGVFLFVGFAKSDIILNTLYMLLIAYIIWAITKNYKYVGHWQAIFYLPILQFAADLAVLAGTIRGILDVKI